MTVPTVSATNHISIMEVGMSNYWDQGSKAFQAFAHRNYGDHLRSADHVAMRWNATWLRTFAGRHPLGGRHVVDYGIGAGLLGKMLIGVHKVRLYTGVDVSSRSINATRAFLSRSHVNRSKWSLLHTPVDFSSLRADVFISQAVIQHFPDKAYTDDFFRNLARSRIPTLLLQIKVPNRNGGREPFFVNHGPVLGTPPFLNLTSGGPPGGSLSLEEGGENGTSSSFNWVAYESEVSAATRLPMDYLIRALPSYRMTWRCLLIGKWTCAPEQREGSFAELPPSWLQLVMQAKIVGEAIVEFERLEA